MGNMASIVGWSDGGIIGLILVIKNPERIDKIFTFGANYSLAGYKDEPADTEARTRLWPGRRPTSAGFPKGG